MSKINSNIVIGIDPGTAIMGYSVLTKNGNKFNLLEYGHFATSSKLALPQRLEKICSELKKILRKFRPSEMAIENIFFSKNVKTAMSVAQARGVVLLTAAQAKIKTFDYNPQQIKLAVTGYGKADKKQVQEMIKRLLCLECIPQPDDAADAIAVAICHLHTNQPLRIKRIN